MNQSSERGKARGLRSSALWGTGGRGGDSRSSALWGKGGRGIVLAAVAALVLAVPVGASAAGWNARGGGNGGQNAPLQNWHDSVKAWTAWASSHGLGSRHARYVQPSLLDQADSSPNQKVQVIVQSNAGTDMALKYVGVLGGLHNLRQLRLVQGITVQVPAKWVPLLARIPGLTVTVDAAVQLSSFGSWSIGGFSSKQLWPYESGNADLWWSSAPQPTIAVVDSGIDPASAGLGNRLLAAPNLATTTGNSPGDGLGHGTMVSAIAAGSQPGMAGADPRANVVSLDVLNDQGEANVSDVIASCDWILQHKDQYNIRVANFSLASTQQSNFYNDPLDQAVEKLWFHGVTVVAAAGNYGHQDGTPSGVVSAPGNDPFVITVGAADLMGTGTPSDDTVAPWSVWGHTHDGFAKPELVAPGRYITGPVPQGSTIYSQFPDRVVAPGYMTLSGTSFAAPVVAGTAAQILALHPGWTPDQVKGALMASTRRLASSVQPGQGGVGELNVVRSVMTQNPPNPNAPLEQFVSTDPTTGNPVVDVTDWMATAQSNPNWDQVSWDQVSWDQVSWDQVSWDQVSWDQVSWDQVSWDQVSWDQVSWDQVSWDQVSWDQVSWDQAASSDPGPLGYDVSSTDLEQIATDGPVLTDLTGS